MTYLRLLIGIVALLGFVASLSVHVAALLGVDLQASVPGVWLLHVGIFAVFIPLVLFSRRDFGERPLPQIAAGLPSWVSVLGVVIGAYTLINFVLFIIGTEGGSPAMRDGKYLLLNHGKLIREISAAEYSAFRANEIRGFSGHWLVFYFLPAAYFLGLRPSRPTPPKPVHGSN